MGPVGGGLKVKVSNTDFFIITASAPLGKVLLGREVGDDIEMDMDGRKIIYEVVAVT